MKNPQYINLTVFIIFFGLALIQALRNQDWLSAGLFLALGVLSFWADFTKRK